MTVNITDDQALCKSVIAKLGIELDVHPRNGGNATVGLLPFGGGRFLAVENTKTGLRLHDLSGFTNAQATEYIGRLIGNSPIMDMRTKVAKPGDANRN